VWKKRSMAQVDEGKIVPDADPVDTSSSNAAATMESAVVNAAGKPEDAAAASRYELLTDPELGPGIAYVAPLCHSPKKQILFNSPNRTASKQGILKKKWRDGYYVPVGRAVVTRGSPLRAPYSTTLIQHCHTSEDRPDRAAKRKNANETVIYSRMISTCSVSCFPPSAPKAKEPIVVNIDFHQVGVAGPAAYLPTKISIENFVDLSKYRKSVVPTLRPILILCGQVNDVMPLPNMFSCLNVFLSEQGRRSFSIAAFESNEYVEDYGSHRTSNNRIVCVCG
jgi:hypothetical protein